MPDYTSPSLLSYDGKTSSIYGVWAKNFLLQLITFGIYRAWGKTNLRRYLWSCCRIEGDRLEYTGKGGELFRGYLKVYLLIFFMSLIGTLINIVVDGKGSLGDPKVFHYRSLLIGLVSLYFLYFGRFSALRYRLTRSSWRGVHGMLRGSGRSYVGFRLKRLAINIGSLGYFIGESDMLDNHYIAERLFFGTQPCRYDGSLNLLNKVNLATILLFLPTLGLSRLWYSAALLNVKYDYLSSGSLSFHADFTPGKLFRLYLGNVAILIVTLFLGMPIVIQRTMRCFSRNVQLLGTIDGAAIRQAEGQAGNFGEGVADYLSYDGFDFDMGII